MSKFNFFDLTPESLQVCLEAKNIKKFVATQLLQWVYEKKETCLESMSNLSKGHRAEFAQLFSFETLELLKQEISDDKQTIKYLWKLVDGQAVESVLILAPGRQTVCVSSQVGCPARCAFCASGKKGLLRHLMAHEIVEQVWRINRDLHQQSGQTVTHVVFMGMGEPLENYDAVTTALTLLMHPSTMGMSKRRITVSTVGIEDKIYRLADEGFGVNLAFSLHAPTQALREKIIPYARKYHLDALLKALRYYTAQTKKDITFEYTLIRGWNDQLEHAHALAALLSTWQCTVNLIPYNPVEGLLLKIPLTKNVEMFRSILTEAGVPNTCRYTKGRDIAAACGQLALKNPQASLPVNPASA